MPRITPRLGFISALIVGFPISIFLIEHTTAQTVPRNAPLTTLSTISIVSVPESLHVDEQPQASTTSQEIVVVEKASHPTPGTIPAKVATPSLSQQVASVVQESVPTPASPPLPSFDATAGVLRAALVNILCYAPAGSGIHSTSGSGVFIDSKGIILTNAHVAQYFLLADRDVSCTIRSGSPAVDRYKAALIHISPTWIHANSTEITKTLSKGTGEYDFALLAITSSATRAALPSSFPSIPLAQTSPLTGAPVVIASFGAQFLSTSQIQSGLSPTIVFGSIKDVFTFGTDTIDVFALGGTAAAQEGSSGGGVADAEGSLTGTITTSTITGTTDTRSLSAITASYIRSEYARETGGSLQELLSKPTSVSVEEFEKEIPALESQITANIL
ncbi:MAG: serine protease [Candidatus Paceibacterota bacterium]|jgi:hypothetical protein